MKFASRSSKSSSGGFMRGCLFHMETKVSPKYFATDCSWKEKRTLISTETIRIVINLSKTFRQTKSFFVVWNEKQMTFVWGGTGSREGKKVAQLQKVKQNFCPWYKSSSKLHISPVTLCDLFSFNLLIPTYWHQPEPLSRSVFAESN